MFFGQRPQQGSKPYKMEEITYVRSFPHLPIQPQVPNAKHNLRQKTHVKPENTFNFLDSDCNMSSAPSTIEEI